MKLFFVVLLGIFTSFVVIMFSYKYYQRKSFFMAYAIFLDEMMQNLNFLKDDMHKILKIFNSNSCKFNQIVRAYEEGLALNNFLKFDELLTQINFLKQEEKAYLSDFFKNLGRTDCQTQKDMVNSKKEAISKKIVVCKNEILTKAGLLQKLGVIFGLVVIILLV